MSAREYVVVSGYYGFDNLGDEAILEEIINEVGRLVEPSKIVVLSQQPEKTSRTFNVQSINRWQLGKIYPYFRQARLFISGGGGLYQDASSVKSVAYYATLAYLARFASAPTAIYAQGIGPLKSPVSVILTRGAMASAQLICVRDSNSQAMLKGWGLDSLLTADPVWCLQPSPLPDSVQKDLAPWQGKFLLGVSLRESPLLTRDMVENFAEAVADAMSAETAVLPLVLQKEQDQELLSLFSTVVRKKGRLVVDLDCSQLQKPSQWISLLSKLDLVFGMRFHALLMSLKSGVPALGLAYDPKVSYLMKNFEQPCLNLANGFDMKEGRMELSRLLESALGNIGELSGKASTMSSSQEELACQNFEVIARILENDNASK